MTRRKAPHEKLKPGPKPGLKQRADEVQAGPPPILVAPAESSSKDPLQSGRNMALMGEAELRRYALQVGVNKRDAESLEPGRLRQNCMLVIQQQIEDYA